MNVRQHDNKVRHWREDSEDQGGVIKPHFPANILILYQPRFSTLQTLTDGRNRPIQAVRHERKRFLLAFMRRGRQKEFGSITHAHNYALEPVRKRSCAFEQKLAKTCESEKFAKLAILLP
jgi:hypothetical protein